MKVPNWLRGFLLSKMNDVMMSREPDVILTERNDPDAAPFLERWHLVPRNRFLNAYAHRFVDDDPGRDLHDHPWASLSILLQGDLFEHHYGGSGNPETALIFRRWVAEGQVRFRRASFAHRLFVGVDGETPVSIFITGPKFREWGFWTIDGWVKWIDYMKVGGIRNGS